MKTEIERLCEELSAAVEALPDDIMPYEIRLARTLQRTSLALSSWFEQIKTPIQEASAALIVLFGGLDDDHYLG